MQIKAALHLKVYKNRLIIHKLSKQSINPTIFLIILVSLYNLYQKKHHSQEYKIAFSGIILLKVNTFLFELVN